MKKQDQHYGFCTISVYCWCQEESLKLFNTALSFLSPWSAGSLALASLNCCLIWRTDEWSTSPKLKQQKKYSLILAIRCVCCCCLCLHFAQMGANKVFSTVSTKRPPSPNTPDTLGYPLPTAFWLSHPLFWLAAKQLHKKIKTNVLPFFSGKTVIIISF